jgi:hypothetical protein
MRRNTRKALKDAAVFFFLILFAGPALLLPGVSLAVSGPVSAKAAYDMAYALAAKWQPDAKLCNFTTLATGPVDAEGRSSEWSLHFSSKKANKVLMVAVSQGVATSFEISGEGGRVIELTPNTNIDSKQLLARANAAGGAEYVKNGAVVTMGLVQNPLPGVGPLWHIGYAKKEADGMPGRELFHVAIEGNSGKLKVL